MGQFKWFWHLCGMWMLAGAIHFQFSSYASSKRVFGQHTLNCKFDNFIWFAHHKVFERTEACSARITGVMEILFLLVTLACYFNFRGIDNDNEITAVNVRRVEWFVLAA